MKNIFWSAYTNIERTAAIEQMQQWVAKQGNIVDFKLFSDLSINLTIEIEERLVDILYNHLKMHMEMDSFALLHSSSKKERTIYLNITFTKGSGNLTIEVPNVPG